MLINDLENQKSYGVQSIDIFPCKKKSPGSNEPVTILAGVRIGDVVECSLTFNEDYVTSDLINSNPKLTKEQKILELQKLYENEGNNEVPEYNISFECIVTGHSSLQLSQNKKKIITCLHPKEGVLVSVGNDQTLMLWDVNKDTCLVSKNLGHQATCLDFSPDGFYIAVGLQNGVFLLIEYPSLKMV